MILGLDKGLKCRAIERLRELLDGWTFFIVRSSHQVVSISKATQILVSLDCISVFEAAREVTGLRNTTDAVCRLKAALNGLRDDYGRLQSPPHMHVLVRQLDRALVAESKEQKARKILPRKLIQMCTGLQSFENQIESLGYPRR